jgi:hypothetical protein
LHSQPATCLLLEPPPSKATQQKAEQNMYLLCYLIYFIYVYYPLLGSLNIIFGLLNINSECHEDQDI